MKNLFLAIKYGSFIVTIFFISSCDRKKTIPFPENPSGFKVPVAKPFEFPEARPLQWKEIPKDSIPKGVTIPFNITKLPSQRFSINDFKPLKSPIETTPLDWNKLDEIKINLDTCKGKPIKVRRFILPKPLITRHNPATKLEGTTSGILSLGQAEGLVGNQICTQIADTLGSIWFSTERGLSKYDGDIFKTYNFLSKGPEGNLELILDLSFDVDGNLWVVANLSGLYKINLNNEIVEHYELGAGFLRIQKDHKGIIWLANLNRGIFFLNSDLTSIHQLLLPIEKIQRVVTYGVFEDTHNNLWIGYANKLAIINSERNSIRLIGTEDGLEINVPYEFTEDSTGKVWISAFARGAKSISLAERKIYTLGSKQGFFGTSRDVVLDPQQRIWIIDNDTVYLYNQASNELKKFPTGAAVRTTGHPAKSIADLNGMIWIGTVNTGLLLVDSRGTFSEHFNTANGLASNDVWGIVEDKNKRVWLATYRGINIYDPAVEKLYLMKFPDNLSRNDHRRLDLLDEDHILIGSVGGFSIIDLKRNTITFYKSGPSTAQFFWAGITDREGNLWISSASGIMKFNSDRTVMWKANESSGLISNTVWVMVPDLQGKIWLVTDKGVNVIDPKANTILALGQKNGLTSDYASIIVKTRKGEMVIGGDKGLSLIDLQKMLMTNVSAKEGLLPESMYDMTESKGRLQIGSENGMIIVDRPTDITSAKSWRFTNYGKREGFPFNDYNQGAAWPTPAGKVWWAAAPILTVTLQDPLIDTIAPKVYITDFNIMDQNPSYLDLYHMILSLAVGDTLWASDKSKYFIKDSLPQDSSYLSQSNITWDSLSPEYKMPLGLKLPHNQNSFSISFTNLDVKGRDKIVYRYILDGADQGWSEVSSKAISKNYYNIQPGDYTFKVATRGFNGVWSQPAELSFTILPPWWQTWWAYFLYVIGFGGAVWFTAQYRSRWLKKENRILEEKVSHRTAQLKQTIEELKGTQSQLIQSEKMASLGELTAGIAHEIQNPLNFVNNFSEVNSELIAELKEEISKGNLEEVKNIANNIDENEKKIIFHGKRADGIVKGMLQHSRSSSGVKEPTDINALADEYLRLAYHGLRAKDKSFNASMKTEFDATLGSVAVVPQDMGRVILNLITNAFYAVTERKKQNENGYEPTVTVSTHKINNKIEIRVKDNGNGIPQKVLDKIFQPFFTTKPAGEGTGLGLSMSYDIVTKTHNGEIKVETKPGVGTEFIIIIPQ